MSAFPPVQIDSVVMCPECGRDLTWTPAAARCDACGKNFPRNQNVLDFGSSSSGSSEDKRSNPGGLAGRVMFIGKCSLERRKRALELGAVVSERSSCLWFLKGVSEGKITGWTRFREVRSAARRFNPDHVVVLGGCQERDTEQRLWILWATLRYPRAYILNLDWGDLRRIGFVALMKKAAMALHPLSSPWSPIVRLLNKRIAQYYERCLTDRSMAERYRRYYLPEAFQRQGGLLLDYGCGVGRFAALYSQLGFQIVGYDVERETFWDRLPTVSFLTGEPRKSLPFRSGTFDLCNHWGVILYIPEDLEHLKEIARVLKPGGGLTLVVINRENPRGMLAERLGFRFSPASFMKLYSRSDLAELLDRAGFDLEDITTEAFHFPFFSRFFYIWRYVILKKRYELADRESWLVRHVPSRWRWYLVAKARKR